MNDPQQILHYHGRMRRQFLSITKKLIVPLGVVALAVGFLYDIQILKALSFVRTPWLNAFMFSITDVGLAIIIVMLALYLVFKKKYLELALMVLTVGMGMEAGYLLKRIFQLPRPPSMEIADFTPLVGARGYGFPSLHATFCFCVLPYVKKICKRKMYRILIWTGLLSVTVSRVYLGVHFPTDIMGGALIGYLSAKTWMYLQEKHQVIEWFVFHVKDKFELRRQIAHMLTGITIVILLKYNYLDATILFIIWMLGGITVLIARKHKIPGVYQVLKFFERPKDINYFPGKGSFFLVLGSLLTLVIFPKDIAMAAIMIMSIGDAVTTVIGTYFGRIPNPLNPVKHLEGTVLSIILSTIAAFTFVNFEKAFLGSVAGMLFESLTVRFLGRIIDDNLLIPLVAALAMVWMS